MRRKQLNQELITILDIKQSEWIQTESKWKTSKPKAAATRNTNNVSCKSL